MRLIIIIIMLLLIGLYCLSNNTSSLILNFLKENNSKLCFLLVCWTNIKKLKMLKIISENRLDLRLAFLSTYDQIMDEINVENYDKISFILDLHCDNAKEIIQNSHKSTKFRFIYSWLMISDSNMAKNDIKLLFDDLELRLDMNVQVAVAKKHEAQYDIFEVYDPGLKVDTQVNMIGNFVNGSFHYFRNVSSFYESRKNMSGVLVRTANTVRHFFTPMENYMNELRHRDIKTFEKYNMNLFICLAKIHNFSYNITLTFPWFGNTSSATDGGISGLLYNNEIDIAAAGGNLRSTRVHFYDFFVTTMIFKGRFFFRNPGKHKIGVQVLKPFSNSTWYVTLCSMLVTSIAIKTAYWVDNKFFNSSIRQSFFTSCVIIIAILAQQGSSIVPHRLGGRIIFLTALVLSILVYNYYTSSLVSSLLSTSPPSLETIKEFFESDLKVGIENQPYTIAYIIQQKNNYYIQKLNSTKIYHPQPNFFTPTVGLEKVKKGGFAYYTETTTAFPIISRTFEQEQICDLSVKGYLIPSESMSLVVSKRSHYRELFQISLLIMKQSGIFRREQDVWLPKPPECLSNLRVISVGKTDLFLVYMILFVGIFLATVIFLVEVIWFRRQMKKTKQGYVN